MASPDRLHNDAPSLHTSLAHRTGYLVSQVGVFAQKRFGERIASIGLTTRMWGALNVLDAAGPITQQQLGKLIGMDPSSMVSTIDGLEARGLVQRRPHPHDRRAYALQITARGQEVLIQGRQLAKEAQDELLAPLDEHERQQLHELMLRIAAAARTVDSAPVRPAAASDPK